MWGAALLVTAACVAALLRLLDGAVAAAALSAVALAAALPLLLLPRDPSERACALAAGAAAGWVVGVALALPAPAGWFFPDVAWHTAKAAVAAAGHPFDDPILRGPTLYPFLFGAVVGAPVALGLSASTAMWLASPVSLAGAFWAHRQLAGTTLGPLATAWSALALPAFLYFPTRSYALLPTPFNFSLFFVFAGLALAVRALEQDDRRRLALAGLTLGTAGLLWYAHLPWIAAWAAWLALRRRAAPLLVGAAPCALLLLLHLAVLASAGLLGDSGVTTAPVEGGWLRWLGVVGRNSLTLSGGRSLADVPFWMGPLLLGLLAVSWLRRPPGRPWMQPALAVACIALGVVAVLLGQRLTYGEFFLWRYTFVLYALLLVTAAGARPLALAGRRLPAAAVAALAAALFAPGWLVARYESSVADEARFDATVAEVQRFLQESTRFDEPVFAPFSVWEGAIGCCAPRPNLVDRQGGLYKYASAALVGERWHDYRELRRTGNAEAIAERLRPYGFRFAVLRSSAQAPGFAALAAGFEVVLRNDEYVVVDLRRPVEAP